MGLESTVNEGQNKSQKQAVASKSADNKPTKQQQEGGSGQPQQSEHSKPSSAEEAKNLKARIAELAAASAALSQSNCQSAASVEAELAATKRALYQSQSPVAQLEGLRGVITRAEKRLAAARAALLEAKAEVDKETKSLAQYRQDLAECEEKIAAELAAGNPAAHQSFAALTKESIDQIANGAMQMLSSTQSAVISGTPIEPQMMIACITQLCSAIHGLQGFIGGHTRTQSCSPAREPVSHSCKRRADAPPERRQGLDDSDEDLDDPGSQDEDGLDETPQLPPSNPSQASIGAEDSCPQLSAQQAAFMHSFQARLSQQSAITVPPSPTLRG